MVADHRTDRVERGCRIRVVAGDHRLGQHGRVRRVFTYKRPFMQTWVYAVMDDGGDAGFPLLHVTRDEDES